MHLEAAFTILVEFIQDWSVESVRKLALIVAGQGLPSLPEVITSSVRKAPLLPQIACLSVILLRTPTDMFSALLERWDPLSLRECLNNFMASEYAPRQLSDALSAAELGFPKCCFCC